MESGKYLRTAITELKGKKYSTLSELAQKAQVSQGNLSSFMKPEGDPGRRENMTFDSAWKILTALGLSFPCIENGSATIRRPGSNAPTEMVEGEALPTVPVYGTAGAGAATELFTGEPETLIQVLPQYNLPDVAAFCVDGDSMEPTIMKGSYVGVVPFSGNISEGGIYLVNMPPFGRVIKRIRMGASGSIELHSDNKVYQPIPLPFEGYEEIVKGKVVWIWQLC